MTNAREKRRPRSRRKVNPDKTNTAKPIPATSERAKTDNLTELATITADPLDGVHVEVAMEDATLMKVAKEVEGPDDGAHEGVVHEVAVNEDEGTEEEPDGDRASEVVRLTSGVTKGRLGAFLTTGADTEHERTQAEYDFSGNLARNSFLVYPVCLTFRNP